MITFLSGDKTFQTGMIMGRNELVNGQMRDALVIEITGSDYAELSAFFVNDAAFAVVDDNGTYDKSKYCVAGAITDHRDGRCTVVMGVKTDKEIMDSLLNDLVADKVITKTQRANIINDRLPVESVVLTEADPETGETVQRTITKKYLEV